jgi:serine/threonine protein kinase
MSERRFGDGGDAPHLWAAQPARAPSDLNAPGARLGPYRLLSLVAAGGMGQVYRAVDERLGRPVALKVLAAELTRDPVRVERFRLEARRVAALRHPHIVPLLDYGEQSGYLYLTMPLYPGTLRDALGNGRPLPPAEADAIVSQVAAALDYAHTCGLIHRDVKPENILLDDQRHALLTDFGIAKSSPSAPSDMMTSGPLAAAEAGQLPLVSLEYSAPEQLLGKPLDPRADVYALGIVVYELMTGRVPFEGQQGHEYALVMRVLTEPPAPPSSHRPGLPPALDAVVLCALHRDPARRYPSPLALATALHEVLAPPAPVTTPLASLRLTTQPIGAVRAQVPPADVPRVGATNRLWDHTSPVYLPPTPPVQRPPVARASWLPFGAVWRRLRRR